MTEKYVLFIKSKVNMRKVVIYQNLRTSYVY